MLRFLSIAALCLLTAGCLGSSGSNDDKDNNVGGTTIDDGMDPTKVLVETPPTNGVLPADLKPPV